MYTKAIITIGGTNMIISRDYGYRTDYSKVELKAGQSVTLEDGLHPKIIHAETILLGVRVRLLVALEVLESGLYENDVDAKQEFEFGIMQGLVRAVSAINSICKPHTDAQGNPQPPVEYARLAEFLNEARYIRDLSNESLQAINGATQPQAM